MIASLLSVSLLIGAALGQTRNPNPCEAAVNLPGFVNDYSSCEAYFWCNAQSQAFPTGPCPEGFGFDPATERCTQAQATCPEECPADITETFAVADPTDESCTRFLLCLVDPDTGDIVRDVDNPQACTGQGTLFNRVTGQCDLASNVICPGAPPGGPPPPDTSCQDENGLPLTGDVPRPGADATCDQFLECNNGVPIVRTPPLSCLPLWFHPETRVCDTPTNVGELCTTPPTETPPAMHIPKAPNAETPQTLKEKILSRLHLKL